jgi:ribosome-associated toxin RatA of RatAB toxin-antitoxin module
MSAARSIWNIGGTRGVGICGAIVLALGITGASQAHALPWASVGISVTASGWNASEAVAERLSDGKVVVESHSVSGSSYPLFRGYGVVDAPPERVWAIVEDCAHYDRTLARIQRSRLISRSGTQVRCESVLDFPAPFDDARVVSDAVHRELPNRHFTRTWTFVEGDFDENRGSWTLLPFDDEGASTLVVYETHAEPHAPVPPGLLKLVQRSAMPNLFRRLRAAAG